MIPKRVKYKFLHLRFSLQLYDQSLSHSPLKTVSTNDTVPETNSILRFGESSIPFVHGRRADRD